jgi:hypothetical protein
MTRMQRQWQAFRFGRAIAAPLGIVALTAAVGCGVRDSNSASAQTLGTSSGAAHAAGSPVLVGCEPTQRTLVRPVIINGATISQVECVTSGEAAVAQSLPASTSRPQPAVEYRTVRAVPMASTSADDLGEARVVRTEAARPSVIPARQVVYRDEVPVRTRPKRTVAKSAVIIGTTAGASAGIGALIGGKKGALIGAAVGGGGATLWDQITRRKN